MNDRSLTAFAASAGRMTLAFLLVSGALLLVLDVVIGGVSAFLVWQTLASKSMWLSAGGALLCIGLCVVVALLFAPLVGLYAVVARAIKRERPGEAIVEALFTRLDRADDVDPGEAEARLYDAATDLVATGDGLDEELEGRSGLGRWLGHQARKTVLRMIVPITVQKGADSRGQISRAGIGDALGSRIDEEVASRCRRLMLRTSLMALGLAAGLCGVLLFGARMLGG